MIDDADDAYDNTHVFQFVILRKRYYLKAKNGFNSLKLTQIEFNQLIGGFPIEIETQISKLIAYS